jgi:hypothetical protein
MPDQVFPIDERIELPGHFTEPVVLEAVRALGEGAECHVRLADGSLEEVVLSGDETAMLAARSGSAPALGPVDARDAQLLVESARIRLAYSHDRQFAVSLSGIRTLPHQIEAVYQKMLPQPRLRMLGANCPWALRRLKEDLKDMDGQRLFPDRHAVTVAFTLNGDEFSLYKSVTAYINQYIPQQQGQRRTSAALARTVLQRRLASSACAIHESLKRRLQKQQNLLDELEGMSPAQRSRRLAVLQGRLADAERDEDDRWSMCREC